MNTSEAALREAIKATLRWFRFDVDEDTFFRRLTIELTARATSEPGAALTQADLTRWEALARNIASELAIGDNAQVLTIIETGLARAAASGKGSEQYKNPADETPWW